MSPGIVASLVGESSPSVGIFGGLLGRLGAAMIANTVIVM